MSGESGREADGAWEVGGDEGSGTVGKEGGTKLGSGLGSGITGKHARVGISRTVLLTEPLLVPHTV